MTAPPRKKARHEQQQAFSSTDETTPEQPDAATMRSRTEPDRRVVSFATPEMTTQELEDKEEQQPKKPRLVITKMVLNNFKSYAGRQVIGPFHKVILLFLVVIERAHN